MFFLLSLATMSGGVLFALRRSVRVRSSNIQRVSAVPDVALVTVGRVSRFPSFTHLSVSEGKLLPLTLLYSRLIIPVVGLTLQVASNIFTHLSVSEVGLTLQVLTRYNPFEVL